MFYVNLLIDSSYSKSAAICFYFRLKLTISKVKYNSYSFIISLTDMAYP